MNDLLCTYIEGVDPPGWCRTHNRQLAECGHIGKMTATYEAVMRMEQELIRISKLLEGKNGKINA